MDNLNKIIEIDITKQARILALFRLTDYSLVILRVTWVIGLTPQLVVGLASNDASTTIASMIIASILGFAAFTGWRHVGVIDPKVWPAYSIVFPLLILVCSVMILVLLPNSGSLSNAFFLEHY